MAMYVFLEINGYPLDAPEAEAVGVMLRLAAGEPEEKMLSKWFKANSGMATEFVVSARRRAGGIARMGVFDRRVGTPT